MLYKDVSVVREEIRKCEIFYAIYTKTLSAGLCKFLNVAAL